MYIAYNILSFDSLTISWNLLYKIYFLIIDAGDNVLVLLFSSLFTKIYFQGEKHKINSFIILQVNFMKQVWLYSKWVWIASASFQNILTCRHRDAFSFLFLVFFQPRTFHCWLKYTFIWVQLQTSAWNQQNFGVIWTKIFEN